MSGAIVQLLRCGLCCIKDLGLFQSTALWDPCYLGQYVYSLPEPLDQTTPLEGLISVAQMYGFVSNSISGCNLVHTSYAKIRRIKRLLNVRIVSQTHADKMVHTSLKKEMLLARRNVWIGLFVMSIGLCFFWFAAHSWHITETNWLGGPPALISAIAVMEVCLLPLLFYMLKDGSEQWARANRMNDLATKIVAGTWTVDDIDMNSLEVLSGCTLLSDTDMTGCLTIDFGNDQFCIADKVQHALDRLLGRKKMAEKDPTRNLNDMAEKLLLSSRKARAEGLRKLICLVLNFVAFYGYLLSILVYYWQSEHKQPPIIRTLMFGMNNSAAGWHGNFASNLMWGLEPVLALRCRRRRRAEDPAEKDVAEMMAKMV
jgi:hypothetical protein